ncbi:MAG: hypothetical protein ACLQBX_01640 [Candidatus Limnocylindrales bacterium]|jgi:hypothetical protein
MADSDEILEHARGNTDFCERPATSACQINPTGLVLWRCHTHGSCLAASSDRRLARLAVVVSPGSAGHRAIVSEQHVRAARGVGEARIWASQATAARSSRVYA